MADPLEKACDQIGLMAATVRSELYNTFEMIALHRNGHPRAQSFDPSGQGGTSPVEAAVLDMRDDAVATTRYDKAVRDGKQMRADIAIAHKALRRVMATIDDYRRAERSESAPADFNAVLAEFGCTMHALLGEYRNRDETGELCPACSRRRGELRKHGLELTLEEVRHYEDPANNGRWPKIVRDPKNPTAPATTSIDTSPKQRYIAGLENLQEGAATLGKAANE